MKRDMDLAREILLKVEQSPQATGGGVIDVKIEGRSDDEVSYHVMLLHQAGLIKAIEPPCDDIDWAPSCLTWDGHEFLDAYREDTFWRKAKSYVLEKTGSLTMEAMKLAASVLIQQAIKGG